MEIQRNLQVCRVCLKTSCRLYSISTLNLADIYKTLSGLPPTYTEHLQMLQEVCSVCAVHLRKAKQLEANVKWAQTMLLDLEAKNSKISLDDIRGTNCNTLKFQCVHFEPNHCDLHINSMEQPTGLIGIVKEESPSLPDAEEENYCYNDSEKKLTVSATKLVEDIKDEDVNGEESDDDDFKLGELVDEESNHNLKMEISIVNENDDKKVMKNNIVNIEVESRKKNETKKRKRRKSPERKSKKKVKGKTARKEKNMGTKEMQECSEKDSCRTTMKVLREHFKVQKLNLDEQKLELEKVKLKANYMKSPFKCDTCYKGFKEEAIFNLHMVKHTESSGQHECPVCHLHFPTQIYYWNHKRSHTTLFSCNRCPFKTQHERTAAHHLNWHRGSTYKCDLCPGVVFDFNTSLARHCRLYHPSALSCVFCGRGCQDDKGLQAHYQWKHAGQPIPEEGPRCEACNVTFANDDALAKHQSLQHDNSSTKKRLRGDTQYPGMFTCVECGKSFSMRCKLRGHMRKAHGRLPPPMSDAEKRAQVLAQRKQCHVCGRFFQSTSLLLDHMDVHTESASHPCPDCGKSFKTRARMQAHQRSHTMQYACPLCEKTFNLPGNRIRHYKNVHKTEKDVECSFCSKGFKNKEECRAHELYVHLKIPRPARTRDRKRTGTPATEGSLKTRKTS